MLKQARAQLIATYSLDEIQANAILDMQLRRLAALERQKLQDEYDSVQARIEYLEDLLASPHKILDLIRQDVREIADEFGDERNTSVVYGNVDLDEADLYRPGKCRHFLNRKWLHQARGSSALPGAAAGRQGHARHGAQGR